MPAKARTSSGGGEGIGTALLLIPMMLSPAIVAAVASLVSPLASVLLLSALMLALQ